MQIVKYKYLLCPVSKSLYCNCAKSCLVEQETSCETHRVKKIQVVNLKSMSHFRFGYIQLVCVAESIIASPESEGRTEFWGRSPSICLMRCTALREVSWDRDHRKQIWLCSEGKDGNPGVRVRQYHNVVLAYM